MPNASKRRWGARQRRALLCYVDHHWYSLGESPSYTHAARVFGCGVSTVRHALETLEREGLVELRREERGTARGGRRIVAVTVWITEAGRRVAFVTRWRRSASVGVELEDADADGEDAD